MNILKNKVIDGFAKHTYKFVVDQYPEWKQFSDSNDTAFWQSWLIKKAGRTVDEINTIIYDNISDYMDTVADPDNDKTASELFQDLLDNIVPNDDDHTYDWRGMEIPEQLAWTQIGKSAIRQAWLQIVKSTYAVYLPKLEAAETKEDLQYMISTDPKEEDCIYPLLSTYLPE